MLYPVVCLVFNFSKQLIFLKDVSVYIFSAIDESLFIDILVASRNLFSVPQYDWFKMVSLY